MPYCGPLSSRPCTLTCASYPLFGPKTALTLHNRALSSLPMSRLRLSDESVTQTDRSHEKQLQRNSRRCVSLCAAPPPPFVCGRTSSRAWPGRGPTCPPCRPTPFPQKNPRPPLAPPLCRRLLRFWPTRRLTLSEFRSNRRKTRITGTVRPYLSRAPAETCEL